MKGLRPRFGRSTSCWRSSTWPCEAFDGVDQRDLFGHLHALADRADLHLEIERDGLLRGHNHVLAFEPLEARRLRYHSVGGRDYLAEVEALGLGNGGPLPAARFIHQRHLDLADRLAGTVENRAANSAQIRLAPRCPCEQHGAEHSLRCHIYIPLERSGDQL